MEKLLLVNGVRDGGIPGDDPGLLLGLTTFESLRTYGGFPFRLEAHLRRLEASALAMGVPLPPLQLIEREILAVCKGDISIRYTLTGGGNRILQALPIERERIGAPVRVATVVQEPMAGLAGSVKHGSRAGWILAAQRLGVDEILFQDSTGAILEANRSNVFAVVGDELRTPPLDGRQLQGVTRAALLDAAGAAGIVCRESPLLLGGEVRELYLSSTLKELAPVVELNGVPAAGAGPIGAALYRAFQELVSSECRDQQS